MHPTIDALRDEPYFNLETFKRSGDGVKTPVWFAVDGDSFVFMTDGRSWKCKRLRRDDRAKVAACDVRGKVKGPWFDGTCTVIDDEAERTRAEAALADKYTWQWRMLGVGARIGRTYAHRAYYRVTPT